VRRQESGVFFNGKSALIVNQIIVEPFELSKP